MSNGGTNGLSVFKPQWAYPTPDGFRDEFYVVPFSFTLDGNGGFVRGLPWSLDDDVPYIVRAIIFPEIGTHVPDGITDQFPGFCRLWEPHGNPLSSRGLVENNGPEYLDLALALGVWCQSGQAGINAFGFPIEPEVACPPGSVITFDFQINTSATPGNALIDGVGEFMEVVGGLMGLISATFTIQTIDPGAPNVPLSVALVGGLHVQVTLGTDGGGALISTFAQVVAAINAAGAAGTIPAPAPYSAFPICYAYLGEGVVGTEIVPAQAQTAMDNGANDATPQTIRGCFLGDKRFQECL
jgi:hypothetical protein